MSFPIKLQAGLVAVYGLGYNDTSPFGVIMPNNYKYGTIYNIWDGGTTFMAVYDIIMFREQDVDTRIVVSPFNHNYTIVPARLATKQEVEV